MSSLAVARQRIVDEASRCVKGTGTGTKQAHLNIDRSLLDGLRKDKQVVM